MSLNRSQNPFHYDLLSPEGEIVESLWMSDRSLADGIEVPAVLWQLLCDRPDTAGIVVRDGENKVRHFKGRDLQALHAEGRIRVIQSKLTISLTVE